MHRLRRPRLSRAHRRGTALILVLLMTVTIAAIAMSAIVLMGSGNMLTRYYDREREFRYAAEAALAMGKARLQKDTTIHLPDSGYVTLISGGTITGADGQPVPRVHVNLYAGMSGSVTGQFGEYASLVAEAYDASGTRYVRRLELAAENFSRFAMFTNTFPPGLCYSTGEFIRGRAHSNQGWYSCNSPTYYDTVSAVLTVSGGSPDYKKGRINHAQVIPIPPVSRLAVLHDRALEGNLDIQAVGTSLSNVRTRLEFVAIDLDQDSDVVDDNEGFFRVYQAVGPKASTDRLRSSPNTSGGVNEPRDDMCGDFHVDSATGTARFYPVSVHMRDWFKSLFNGHLPSDVVSGGNGASVDKSDRDKVMQSSSFRCYPEGDPHLVATERALALPRLAVSDSAEWQKGGEDTTFTDSTDYGFWQKFGGDQNPTTNALNAIPSGDPWRGFRAQAAYLFPLHRTLNIGSKGVIHVHGPVLLSGVLRGRVMIYAQTIGGQTGAVGYVDDLVYAQDPASVLCANILGVLSDDDQMILDNAINSPQRAGSGKQYRWTDGDDNGMLTSHDFVLHGVTMSRTGTVGVENFNQHAEGIGPCNGGATGRGCIRQAGGVIEELISATWNGGGTGFGENRSVDLCLTQHSPPYFPTTGRYIDNRFYETDPARFDVASLFRSLQGGF